MSTPVTLTGRLAADPELRFTPGGKAVCNFRVLTSRSVKTDTGWEDRDTTGWDVSVWDTLAEDCAEQLRKGTAVIVVGHASTRMYERTDGTKGMSLDVKANSVGPDMRWAKVRVDGKAAQRSREGSQVDDPWRQPNTQGGAEQAPW